jgi:hypothetical protein
MRQNKIIHFSTPSVFHVPPISTITGLRRLSATNRAQPSLVARELPVFIPSDAMLSHAVFDAFTSVI